MKKHFSTLILLVFSSAYAFAQLFDAPPDSGGFEEIVDTAPVDGGIAFLVVAGIGYGVKKLYSKK
jgi:hypothetical protein